MEEMNEENGYTSLVNTYIDEFSHDDKITFPIDDGDSHYVRQNINMVEFLNDPTIYFGKYGDAYNNEQDIIITRTNPSWMEPYFSYENNSLEYKVGYDVNKNLIETIGVGDNFSIRTKFIFDSLLEKLYNNIDNNLRYTTIKNEYITLDVKLNIVHENNCEYKIFGNEIIKNLKEGLHLENLHYINKNLSFNFIIFNDDKKIINNTDILKYILINKDVILHKLYLEIIRCESNEINSLKTFDDLDEFKITPSKLNFKLIDEIIEIIHFYDNISNTLPKSDLFSLIKLKGLSGEYLKHFLNNNAYFNKIKYIKTFDFDIFFQNIVKDNMTVVNDFLFEKEDIFFKLDLDVKSLSVKQKINLLVMFINRLIINEKIKNFDELILSFSNLSIIEINSCLNNEGYYKQFMRNGNEINKTANKIINKIASIINN